MVDLKDSLESYVQKVQLASDIHFKNDLPTSWANGQAPIFSFTEGKRFFKVIKTYPGAGGGSVFCFVERTSGDIYKPASWNAPAKGVRFNILRDMDILKNADWAGSYLYIR